MPESCEVKLTTDYLNSRLENKIILKWVFIGGQYEEKHPDGFNEFKINLPLIVDKVNCKGKLIYFVLHNEFQTFYILHSLRVTGRWQVNKDKYCRWYIEFKGENDTNERLWFHNPRCLATLCFTTNKHVFNNNLSRLGPDILSDKFTLTVWEKLLTMYKNRNITSFLMDQRVISGCGVYIKSEALWYAKISPLRKVKSLKQYETDLLYEALRIIPRIAYNYKGLSLKNYTDHNGRKGSYEYKLQIYGKKHAQKTKTADGRTTYWDPDRQI